MAEAGLPGFAVESWQGYLAPGGTTAAVVDKINHGFQHVLRLPEVRARLEDLGFKVAAGPPAELGATLQREHARYAQVVRAARIALK
jgi:tripartite-type tricarboxylate transporter receptor subunit TctC